MSAVSSSQLLCQKVFWLLLLANVRNTRSKSSVLNRPFFGSHLLQFSVITFKLFGLPDWLERTTIGVRGIHTRSDAFASCIACWLVGWPDRSASRVVISVCIIARCCVRCGVFGLIIFIFLRGPTEGSSARCSTLLLPSSAEDQFSHNSDTHRSARKLYYICDIINSHTFFDCAGV